MLLALPVAFGLLIGKISGGSFRVLANAPLRGAWLFLIGFAIQVALYNPGTARAAWDIRYGHVLYVISLLLLLLGLTVNLRRLRWPVFVLATGAALNFLVIAANGGAMPVDAHQLVKTESPALIRSIRNHHYASNVAPAGRQTRLAILDDHIRIPSPLFGSVFSIGDLFIGIGGFLLIVSEMHRQPAEDRSRRHSSLSRSTVSAQ